MPQGSFSIEHGIDGDAQESNFMNATTSTIGEDGAISIAVYPNLPADLDINDAQAVQAYLERIFAPLVASGCDVEIQTSIDAPG